MRWPTWRRAARSWATNLDRHLLAHHSWNTTGHSVRLANLAALFDLNGFGVALTSTLGFANRTCAAFRDHFANTVSAGFGFALRDHFASCVVTDFASVLTNHSAHFVAHFFGSTLWHHLAGGVIANLGSILANHSAHFVAHFFGSTLWDHSANSVVASFSSALRYHFANTVSTSLGSTLRHNTTDGVWNLPSSAFASVSCAADFFLFAGWYPDLFADGLRRTLHALCATFTRRVDTLAGARVVSPSPRLAYGLFHDRAGDRLSFCLPMSALNSHRTGILFRNANTVRFSSHFLFANRVVYGVVDLPGFCFIDWLANGVVDSP